MLQNDIKNKIRPLVLVILDGWGYRTEPDFNAIAAAYTPTWDKLWQQYPHTLISGSGLCVGLPNGQMGNSEVGHLTMGAGRLVYQDLTKIDHDIETGEFYKNKLLRENLLKAKNSQATVHLMGLLSPGGVHSHENHFYALIKMAAEFSIGSLQIHAFLDGRDTPPQSAMASIAALEKTCDDFQCGAIASLIGRYYAMDRDKRWERVEKAYQLLTEDNAEYSAETARVGLENAYARMEFDEFVKPTKIANHKTKDRVIKNGDLVIFINFRSDRARELTQCFVDTNFQEFSRKHSPKLLEFICMREYDENFPYPIIYPNNNLKNIFPEIISQHHLKQLRIAETEKYAHVTFFFNAGREELYAGEDRILVPSPKVATYDLQPEMSAANLTDRLIEQIEREYYDVIICNYANADMVGHTGDFAATVKAIETIDQCLEKIMTTQANHPFDMIITADHGNAEYMYDSELKQSHTAHTTALVPFIYIGRSAVITETEGKLSDIAPTMLYSLGLDTPAEMTGKSLVGLNL